MGYLIEVLIGKVPIDEVLMDEVIMDEVLMDIVTAITYFCVRFDNRV
jgi:hypothetical protein